MSSFSAASADQDLGLKLSENERILVARLFSDPTYFPIEFRTWLKNYIQDAGISVTASQISGGSRSRTGLPPGMVVTCATVEAVPPDALPADGRAVSRTVYSALYLKLGTKWGAGDGSTTFNLPDYRDRSLYGVGTAVAEAATDGQTEATRGGPVHQHGTHGHSASTSVPVQAFNAAAGSGSVGATTGDRAIPVVAIGVSAAQVGPVGTNVDAPNWGAVVYAVTTGQTG